MSLQDIAALGKLLGQFLSLFADCFRRPAGRLLLAVYVRGLLSNVQRKNVEALALAQERVEEVDELALQAPFGQAAAFWVAWRVHRWCSVKGVGLFGVDVVGEPAGQEVDDAGGEVIR